MTDHVPVRRLDTVSKNTHDILTSVSAALAKLQAPTSKGSAVDPSTENFVRLDKALASGAFTYHGKSLYKEADTDTSIGRVWLMKEFDNPDTGEKEKWLVAYTTDEDDIIRQVASEQLVVVAASAQPSAVPKAKDIPLAPGLKSKNLTLDETGGGGTAKVTLEFTDVDQGLKFYQEQQGAPAEEKKEEAPAEGEGEGEAGGSEAPAGSEQPQGKPQVNVAPVPPVPGPAGGGMMAPPQAGKQSTIEQFTRLGKNQLSILRKQVQGKQTLSFINEKGEEWAMPAGFNARVGDAITRPDTGDTIRLARYIDINYEPVDSVIEALAAMVSTGKNYYCNTCQAKFSDKQMNFHNGHNTREYGDETDKSGGDSAKKTAADVSDNVPPMSFKTDESDKSPAGAGEAMPPNPALQDAQAPEDKNVLYDSNQDSGPQFQTTINPKDKSVTVKFVDSQAEDALQQALNQPAPGAAPPAPAAMPGQPAPGAPPPAPGAGGPAPFDQQKIPTEF